jgi:hypothetical protein
MTLLTLPLCKIFFPVLIRNFRLLFLCLSCCLFSCQERVKTISFYYWKPAFTIDSAEGNTLNDNNVHTLYVRYFDIDWSPSDTAPVSATPLFFTSSPSSYTIIPVVCVRNRVFEKLNPAAIPSFAADIFSRVRNINASRRLQNHEIQFDCDWTEKTRENYFAFLRQYHRISVQSTSSMIRMYQLKYADRAGVPPVDHGVLLYFNLENTDSGDERSVYDRALAHRYTPSLRSYPLTLDVALPVFPPARETKDGEDLLEIVTDINRHSNHHIRNLIFFDLDRDNLRRYDKTAFKEMLAHTD